MVDSYAQRASAHSPRASRPPGWEIELLYDGDCPLCRREVAFLSRRDRSGRLALVDIAAPEFDPGRYGLDRETVMGSIHGVLPDGRSVEGMEVFRRVYAAVGLGWLLAPSRWPGLRWIFDRAYRVFARHRLRWTGRDPAGACDCAAHVPRS